MKRATLTVSYYASLLLAAAVLGWATLRAWHSPIVRIDAGVIWLLNLAYWLFVFYVLRKGGFKTDGVLVSYAEEPKRFSVYFIVMLLMGLVAAIAAAGILFSKAAHGVSE